MNVGDDWGTGESGVGLEFVEEDKSAFADGGDGCAAADARREKRPRRGFGWTRGVVVAGVGVDTVRVIDTSVSGVGLLGRTGFVDDLDLPFVFCRAPGSVSISLKAQGHTSRASAAICVAVHEV
jgi:hypothetical protein